MNDHESHAAWWKLLIVWAGTVFGSLTLQQWVLVATLIYTLVNLVTLIRDKWIRRPKE